MNGPNVVGEPITLGKDVMVPCGIPGGTQKEVLDGGAPLDLATVHDHKNVIRAVSLHTVSVGCAEQDNDSVKSLVGISFAESLEFDTGAMKSWSPTDRRVGLRLEVMASQCPVSEISLQRGTSGG